MAITKIHPIKTTLNLSIDYICDAKKTDDEILIFSYKCGYKTASLQFENTKEIMNSQCKNLARHLIQSFMPGEVSPTLAHHIGQELCDKHLKGKYEYVLTTHIDKGHIHNHIIFNNVSFIDGKAYISNKKSYYQIRNENDQICKENGLSIISGNDSQNNNKTKGKSYKEYQAQKNGNSYKAKLKYTIDLAIKKSKNWDEFINLMQEYGYEIKYGKHISFKAINQERFTRAKTIGLDYSEDRLKERIENRANGKLNHTHRQRTPIKVVDIKSNTLASESAGFAKWLKLQNLKNMAKTWQTLSDQNITNLQSFNNSVENIHDEYTQCLTKIKYVELEIRSLSELLIHLNTYEKFKYFHTRYSETNNPEAFFQQYEKELILFLASKDFLKNSSVKMPLNKKNLDIRMKSLSHDLTNTKHKLVEHKRKVSDINILKHNFKTYLSTDKNIINKNHNI
jgi:hypothetical protein